MKTYGPPHAKTGLKILVIAVLKEYLVEYNPLIWPQPKNITREDTKLQFYIWRPVKRRLDGPDTVQAFHWYEKMTTILRTI